MKQDYIDTVRVLIDIAPTIFKSPRFAMKGGTALNLFLQGDDALKAIESDLAEAAKTLEGRGYKINRPRKPSPVTSRHKPTCLKIG